MSARDTDTEPCPVLVYDASCALCVRSARWALAHARPDAPYQLRAARDVHTSVAGVGLGPEELARSAWWIEDDRRYEGARAVARVLRCSNGWWPLVGRTIERAPVSWLAGAIYRFVASNRARLDKTRWACNVGADDGPGPGRIR